MSMNIYAKNGDFVVFTHPENGYEVERERAARYLEKNKIYTIDWTEVGQSHTYVRLVEFQDVTFNSVQFSDYQEVN